METKYNEAYSALKWYVENKMINEVVEESRLENLKTIRLFLTNTIHENLAKVRTKENETKIREMCQWVIEKILPFIKAKLKLINFKRVNSALDEKELVIFNDYLDLEDDFFAIASFRSLPHFAMYMERQDSEEDKVWKYTMDETMGSIFYYSNKMILEDDIHALVKQTPAGYGKCFHANQNILTSTGYKKAKDLKIGDFVYSMKENKPVLRKIVNRWNTIKKQVKITARNGVELIVSPEHRMWTQRGYVQAKDLTTDDYLYYLCSPLEFGENINEDELKFISMMLFDGSCTNCTQFTKKNNEIYQECIKVSKNLNFSYSSYQYKDKSCCHLTINKNDGRPVELLRKYGIFNHYSTNKRLPKQFFTMSLKQRYEFIGIMFATDGYIPKYSCNGGCNIGITLANKELCEDIQLLLSTCGIYSNLAKKNIKGKEKNFEAWVLTVPDEFTEKIYKNCYCYQKQKALEERYLAINNLSMKPYSNCVNYPKSLLENCKELKKAENKSWTRNKTFKREIVHRYVKDKKIISDDFYWNKIISIKNDDTEVPMIDFEVEDTHNFILDGFVSHNSKSDCVIMCFILGYDVNADIIKVVGNPTAMEGIVPRVVEMLKSKRFGKVFPVLGKYNGSDDMFKRQTISDNCIALADSTKAASLVCFNKETKTSGIRGNYQFYDDITQAEDAENISKHERDVSTYQSVWSKREYNQFKTKRWFTGTSYNREDFICKMIDKYSKGLPLCADLEIQKYKWAKFCKKTQNGKMVVIRIPKLVDLELGEDKCYCSFPEKFSKEEALDLLHSDAPNSRRSFYAMEQQSPLPPESMKFDWVYLRTYKKLPKDILDNNCFCRVIIDPSRKGKDNYAALIFKSIDGQKDWYFVDCYYEQKVTSKYAIPEICKKAAFHKADTISFEQNATDASLITDLIKTELLKNGNRECNIDDFWSQENKEEKILKYSDDILTDIIFPDREIFHIDSPMGRAMKDITCYSFDFKVVHDDSIDCCAMFESRLKQNNENTIEVLDCCKLY